VTVLRLAEGLVLRTDWSRRQQIGKELRGGLIVLKGFWRRSRGLCVDKLQRCFPSSDIEEHVHGSTCWTLDMMMFLTACLQSDSKCPILNLPLIISCIGGEAEVFVLTNFSALSFK